MSQQNESTGIKHESGPPESGETYLNNDFTPGHILTINDVIFLRPKGKVEPSTFYKKFIGKKIIKNLKLGDELDFSAI